MNTIDFSPLMRIAVGYDKLGRLVDAAHAQATGQGYPPYNILKTGEDSYRLTLAVAGLGEDDVEIVTEPGKLSIRGKGPAADTTDSTHYLHRGIALRAFTRDFALAEYIQVDGAALTNGMLDIELRRVLPEAAKPRVIAIKSAPVEAIAQAA